MRVSSGDYARINGTHDGGINKQADKPRSNMPQTEVRFTGGLEGGMTMAVQQTRQALAPTHQQPTAAESRVQQRDRQYLNVKRQMASNDTSEERVATGLGWFSIGLGLAEVLAPKGLAKLIGTEGKHTGLIRFMGLREITAGVGILTNRRPTQWVWARVAGDALDLTCLAIALMSEDADRGRVAGATAAVLGVTALDIMNAQQLSTTAGAHGGLAQVNTITINRPPEEVYRFWRD